MKLLKPSAIQVSASFGSQIWRLFFLVGMQMDDEEDLLAELEELEEVCSLFT